MNNSLQAYRNIKKDFSSSSIFTRPMDIKLFPFSMESSKPCYLKKVTSETERDLERIKQQLEDSGHFFSLYRDYVGKTAVMFVSVLDALVFDLELMGFIPFGKSEYYVNNISNVYIKIDSASQLNKLYNQSYKYVKPIFQKYGNFECFKAEGTLCLKGSHAFVESLLRAKYLSIAIRHGRFVYLGFTQEIAELVNMSYSSEDDEDDTTTLEQNRSPPINLSAENPYEKKAFDSDSRRVLKSSDTKDTVDLIEQIDREINSDYRDSILLSDSESNSGFGVKSILDSLTDTPYTNSRHFSYPKLVKKFGTFKPVDIVDQEYDMNHSFTVADIESSYALITPIPKILLQSEEDMRQLSHDLTQRFQKFASGKISNISINKTGGFMLLEMRNKKSVIELIRCIHGVIYKYHHTFQVALCDLAIGKELYKKCEWNCSTTELNLKTFD